METHGKPGKAMEKTWVKTVVKNRGFYTCERKVQNGAKEKRSAGNWE